MIYIQVDSERKKKYNKYGYKVSEMRTQQFMVILMPLLQICRIPANAMLFVKAQEAVDILKSIY